MVAIVAGGRLASGEATPRLSRAFAAYAKGDYEGAIPLLEAVVAERDRIGRSRAQTDLVEFTLLRGLAGREAEARGYVAGRRRKGPVGVLVAGVVGE